ncbi:MAG: hypothetical protein LBJ57_07595 [Prevotellaceae bacterium]|nr:hypothetical protein [Prevotellaceae bacterium]
MKKTDVPREVFALLGLKWSDRRYTSKETESGGGETVTKKTWEDLYDHLQKLVADGKLIV